MGVRILQSLTLRPVRLLPAALLALLSLSWLPAPPLEAQFFQGKVKAFRNLDRNMFGIPFGRDPIVPRPKAGTGNYYRFYYSPSGRLLTVLRIDQGKKNPNFYIRLTWQDGAPVRIRSPRYTMYLKWSQNNKRVRASRLIKNTEEKKPAPDGPPEAAGELDDEEPGPGGPGADDQAQDITKNFPPFNLFYHYQKGRLYRIDQLTSYTPKKAPAGPGEVKKVPVVKSRIYEAGRLRRLKVFRSAYPVPVRQVLYFYGQDGELSGTEVWKLDQQKAKNLGPKIKNQKYVGENFFNKSIYRHSPFKKHKKPATVLRSTVAFAYLGKQKTDFNQKAPFIQEPRRKNLFLSAGEQVQLLGYKEMTDRDGNKVPWYKLIRDKESYWLRGEYLSIYGQYYRTLKAVVLNPKTRLYERPDFQSKILAHLPLNRKVRLRQVTRGRGLTELQASGAGPSPAKYFNTKYYQDPGFATGPEGPGGPEEEPGAPEYEEDGPAGPPEAQAAKKKKDLEDYEIGYPWYYIIAGKKRGWVHGKNIGENFRKWGNHFFIWQYKNNEGRILQFDPNQVKYTPVPKAVWPDTRFRHFNNLLQKTNVDLRDIDGDKVPELLIRRFLDYSKGKFVHYKNDLLVYNLSDYKAFPIMQIDLSEVRFQRHGPLGPLSSAKPPYLAQGLPGPDGPPEAFENEEGAPPYAVEEEEEEEEVMPSYMSGGETEEGAPEPAGPTGPEGPGGPGGPPAQKNNFTFNKVRVYFYRKKWDLDGFVLRKQQVLLPRKPYKGRPVDGPLRRKLFRLDHKVLYPKNQNVFDTYKIIYHPKSPQAKPGNKADYWVPPKYP